MSKKENSTNVVANEQEVGELVYLDPNDVGEPESSNVRPWSALAGDSEAEIRALEELGRSMAEEGQLQPVVVVRVAVADGEDVRYDLIAGRRRKKALIGWNFAADANVEPRKLLAVVFKSRTAAKMYRAAMHENTQRVNLSPMDLVADMAAVRKKYKWTGEKGTVKVAEWFGVSPAQVTQYEKLLELPGDMQVDVHQGRVTREDAFKLAEIAKVSGAAAAARVLAEARAVESGLLSGFTEAMNDGPVDGGYGIYVEDPAATPNDTRIVPVGPEVLDTSHLTDAQRAQAAADVQKELKAASKGKGGAAKKPATKKQAAAARSGVIAKAAAAAKGKTQKVGRTEIVEFFGSMDGPGWGHANCAVRVFARVFVDWTDGKVSEGKLEDVWEALVEGADQGFEQEADQVKAAAKKPTQKKPAVKKLSKPKAAKKTTTTTKKK